MTREESDECFRIRRLKARVVRILGGSAASGGSSASASAWWRFTSTACTSSPTKVTGAPSSYWVATAADPSGVATIAELTLACLPSPQSAPRVVRMLLSAFSVSVRRRTLSCADMRMLYRKVETTEVSFSTSSSLLHTTNMRSGQSDHLRCLRRMTESSSSSPPSCTTHQMSTGLRCTSGLGRIFVCQASCPLIRMRAMLNAWADVRIRIIRSAPAILSFHDVGQAVITVFGPRPPSPAVCSSESSAVDVSRVITTCVKPAMPLVSRWWRSFASTSRCSPASFSSSPSIAVEMIEMPRDPLSSASAQRRPGWCISLSAATLAKSSTCGRQFFTWTEVSFSSCSSALRARWYCSPRVPSPHWTLTFWNSMYLYSSPTTAHAATAIHGSVENMMNRHRKRPVPAVRGW
mmetsp:Transcript_29807/g.50924  ORF Transcript_29807/g.50924 Transcript_29807/m.50924 type:complete len:406 (-) Transcript_29807:986-2203(-)